MLHLVEGVCSHSYLGCVLATATACSSQHSTILQCRVHAQPAVADTQCKSVQRQVSRDITVPGVLECLVLGHWVQTLTHKGV